MTKSNPLLKKFAIDKKEFTTAEKLKNTTKPYPNYKITIRHLSLSRNHATRIFKGIFYIKTPEQKIPFKPTPKNTPNIKCS
ncbi:MAG: hypothetical protein LBQ98_06790 [Nitrososphaerota archaeon]|nr:hypothetical protein [Nitrososphaerota archaeon]